MAFLIDQLNNSGLFAQSAYSACIATKDSDGNDITATYLTAHQPISAEEWNSSYETVQTNSGSWGGGTVESYDLSAGDNIQITKDDVNSAIGIAVTGLNTTNWDSSYTALTSNSGNWNNTRTVVYNNSANWNNTRSTVQSNSASWAQGTTYTEGDGIDITNNVISLDSPIVFSAGSGLSVTMDSNTARIDVTAQGGGAGDMEVSNLDYATIWDDVGNPFYTISGYGGSAFGLGSFYVTNSDSIFKNGGDSLIEINDIGIRLDNPDGGYSEQNSFYGGDYFHIGSYSNPSAYIEGYANGRIELFDVNHVSGSLNVSAISSWNDVHNTVQSNSASWGGGSTYTGDAQGALDEVYTNSGNWNDTYTNVSTNSAGWGGDTVALSAGEGIGIDLGVSAVTISSTYGSDISYLSATIGDVESLLAQL